MATLGELRQQVINAQRYASGKITRLAANGIIVNGSDNDVRVTTDRINRYNRAQLLTQLARVRTFNKKATTFVPGIEGVAIRKSTADAYYAAQARVNAKADVEYARVRDVVLPGGNTIGFVEEKVRGDGRGSLKGNHRPLEPIHREVAHMTGEKAVKRLTRSLQSIANAKVHRGEIHKQSVRVFEALKQYGNDEILERFNALTTNQKNILLNYTHSQTSFFDKYLEMMLALRGKTGKIINENAESETLEWIKFAEDLPKQARSRKKE